MYSKIRQLKCVIQYNTTQPKTGRSWPRHTLRTHALLTCWWCILHSFGAVNTLHEKNMDDGDETKRVWSTSQGGRRIATVAIYFEDKDNVLVNTAEPRQQKVPAKNALNG